jgi:hypothetical protein
MTLRSICFSCALALFGGASLAGCGSDDSARPASTPFSSGVPDNKTFDTLTDADVTNLCSSLRDRLSTDPALKEATCHFAGFSVALSASFFGAATDADLQKMCTDIQVKCLGTTPTVEQSTCSKPTSACSATVGEFEACVTDALAAATQAFATLPACSSITNASLSKLISGGNGGMPMTVETASCKTLEQKCPGVQDSTGLSSVNDSSSQ